MKQVRGGGEYFPDPPIVDVVFVLASNYKTDAQRCPYLNRLRKIQRQRERVALILLFTVIKGRSPKMLSLHTFNKNRERSNSNIQLQID